MSRWSALLLAATLPAGLTRAAELILPQERNAYYADEPIELTVAGLEAGASCTLELVPGAAGLATVAFPVRGDGSTVTVTLPPLSLAPSTYALRLGGQDTGQTLTVAGGVNRSTMLLSQTVGWEALQASGANFILGNAFSFGRLTPEGLPLVELRGRRSPGLEAFERATAMNLPTVVYMYWTGYVTHKPWGAEKSWTEARMVEAMRLFNLHVAQRLRRYDRNILSVGTLDEPGLNWGRTPTGGFASGFPNWDDRPWYEARGWEFTPDFASRSDEDWTRYMAIRGDIIRQSNAWAKEDLRSIWPEVVFSTDLYAPQAIMDGTDPLAQQVNDLPATHVFLDWGMGKLGVIGAVYLEKAHDPTAKVAHAMNGQLFGDPVPQPAQSHAYRVMLNGLLAAGLHSNWWLNCTGMSNTDLAAINEPGLRLGPLFAEMAPTGHDVAILWSSTELCLREKAVAVLEAQKAPGEQLRRRVTDLPPNSAFGLEGAEVDYSAYSVGGNYREQILAAHQALSRAGYPAHIIHEGLLGQANRRSYRPDRMTGLATGPTGPGRASRPPHPEEVLEGYKTLVIVGQTFALPEDVMAALRAFAAEGGRIVVDRTTTVPFEGALVTEADFADPSDRWGPLFTAKPEAFESPREASYFQTNHFMDEMARRAVAPMKATMQRTESRPAIVTDVVDLAAERHAGGDGALIMVLNGHEELPEVPADGEYPIYNHAPYEATYSLQGVPRGSAVHVIEGGNWDRVRLVEKPWAPQQATFEPGEMKLYLVAPRPPRGLKLSVRQRGNSLAVSASLQGLRMPWPLTVTVVDPAGAELFRLYRATDARGRYAETLPLGGNALGGTYQVVVGSPVAGMSARTRWDLRRTGVGAEPLGGAVRVFDEPAIRAFLQGKPDLVVALGSAAYREAARRLAADLGRRGCNAEVRPEAEVIRRARYPRVWDPYIKVHQPTGDEALAPGGAVQREVRLETADDGRTVARTPDGADLGEQWVQPGTLATVGGAGYTDFAAERFYEAGCRLYVDEQNRQIVVDGEPVEVQATEEVRRRWSRPWVRLSSFVGTDKLCPQLPEAYSVEHHLVLLGDSTQGELIAALQASELLLQVADAKYPGPGKALVSLAWSPFALGKNVILVGAADRVGVEAGVERLVELAGG